MTWFVRLEPPSARDAPLLGGSLIELLAEEQGETEQALACYAEALREGYRWHEFGDVNLLLAR